MISVSYVKVLKAFYVNKYGLTLVVTFRIQTLASFVPHVNLELDKFDK